MRDLNEHNMYILSKIVDKNWSTSLKSHPKDLSGLSFNDLYVDHFLGRDIKNRGYWVCKCKCGNITYVRGDSIKDGRIKSCGCKLQKHGDSESRLFNIWCGMLQRCNNPNNDKYYRYGKRGITVCDEWQFGENPFIIFKDWAYNNGYSEYYELNRKEYISIDRIDNDIGYCPENCRWVSNDDQAINKSYTIYLRYNKYVFSLSIWKKITGLSRHTLYGRYCLKWHPYDILTIPNGNFVKKYNGKRINLNVPIEYYKYNKFEEFYRKGLIDLNNPDICSVKYNQLSEYESEVR